MRKISLKAKLIVIGLVVALEVGVVAFLLTFTVAPNTTAGSLLLANAAAATNYDPCSCVSYVRYRTGLPGGPATAAGYTQSFMNSKGYKKVTPQHGAILVWDARQKGAGSAGHMAIINGASYNSKTKQWNISVMHANWSGCGVRSNTFSWGDLYGVNAYRK